MKKKKKSASARVAWFSQEQEERARPGPAPVARGSTVERKQSQWERQRKCSRLEGDENTRPLSVGET